MAIRVLVWNENRHEKKDKEVAAIYPEGIHGAIARHLRSCGDMRVETTTLDEPEHGCDERRLNETDVLMWWGHMAHHEVSDAVAQRVQYRVLGGMGFIALHSGHMSKPFMRLMGTTCDLKWREAGEREILWVTKPGHPILRGIEDHFVLEREEMYGEFFDVPEPMETLLISSFGGGEVFRSGLTFQRGGGRIFYFRPGHETYPTYYDANVLRILENGVRWAAPVGAAGISFGQRETGWV